MRPLLLALALPASILAGCLPLATPPRAPLSEAVRSYLLPGADPFPNDLVVAADGAVWYVDRQEGAVGRLDPESGAVTVRHTPSAGSIPYGLAPGAPGELWYTAAAAPLLGRVEMASGDITELPLPSEVRGTIFLAVQDGRVWFTSPRSDRYGFLEASSGEVRLFEPPTAGARPYHIASAPDGAVWVTFLDLAAVVRIDPADLSARVLPLPEPASRARRVVFDEVGGVWYADLGRRRLGRLDARTGEAGESLSSELRWMPYGLLHGPDGRLWFGDAREDRVLALDPADGSAEVLHLPATGTVVRNLAADRQRGRVWFVMGEAGALGRVDLR